MYGRRYWCLLGISMLLLAATFLPGQSGRDMAAPDLTAAPSRINTDPGERDATSALRHRMPLPPGTLRFPAVVRAAGTIFSGTVISIARHAATRGQTVGTVAITFHVEYAIRGATSGESLTISQWIGLWSGGQRYRIGERVLLFLYPPSKLGLTSCVSGAMGRFMIDPRGRVLLSAQHLSAFQTDPVLGGKSRLRFSDFAWAVRQAGEEE